MIRHSALPLIALVALLCPTAQSHEDQNASYLPFVESHLRNLTTHGLDVYGPKKTGDPVDDLGGGF